jgi:ribonuclease-3
MGILIVGSVHPSCGSMSENLNWEVPSVEKNLGAIEDCVRNHLDGLPKTHVAVREKMERWLDRFGSIRQGISAGRYNVQPLIERDLGYALANRELVVAAMFQPSTKNLFSEIEAHFRSMGGCALPSEDLLLMAGLPEVAKTLAWIGDAAMNLGVLPLIWSPRVADVGALTEKRKRYVRNTHVARLADRWSMYQHRIHFDTIEPGAEAAHIKGTLVESIFGIVYLQGGLSKVTEASRLLTF